MNVDVKQKILSAVEDYSELLWHLATTIHANPELAFQEKIDSDLLSETLAKEGFDGLPILFHSWEQEYISITYAPLRRSSLC